MIRLTIAVRPAKLIGARRMITIKLTIPKQELPTKELRALLAAALLRGTRETNSWQAEDAVMAAARAMQDAKITETM